MVKKSWLKLSPTVWNNFSLTKLSNADLSAITFVDCSFSDCSLSLIHCANTVFRDVSFQSCKMWGIHFERCNKFGLAFRFDHCSLHLCSFYQTSLPKTIFHHTDLREADFTPCNLTGSQFIQCDFTGALFDRTILEKADLRTSVHYSIDPTQNRIKKAKFSVHRLEGLLHAFQKESLSPQ